MSDFACYRWPYDTEKTYSSTEVCRLAGVSYRRLDYWIRQGYLGDSRAFRRGTGMPRRFTDEHLADVIRIREAFDEAVAVLERAGLRTTIPALIGSRHTLDGIPTSKPLAAVV